MSWLWEKFLKSFLLGEMTLLLIELLLYCFPSLQAGELDFSLP